MIKFFKKYKFLHVILVIIIAGILFFGFGTKLYNLYYYEPVTSQSSTNGMVKEIQKISLSSEEYDMEVNGNIYLLKNHKLVYVAEYTADKDDNVGILINYPKELIVTNKMTTDDSYVLASCGTNGKTTRIEPSIYGIDGEGFIVIEFKIPPSVYRQGEFTIHTYFYDGDIENTFVLK